MRSLQEWMKYLEEQEESVKDQPEQETPAPQKQASPASDVAVLERPAPAAVKPPVVVEPAPSAPPVEQPQMALEAPASAPTPAPVAVAPQRVEAPAPAPASVTPKRVETPKMPVEAPKSQPKARKPRTPKAVMGVISPKETAQKSYQPFRESREELLQRLLDPMISLEEAARILNVCPTTVRRYTNRGLLTHHRTAGNQRRFRLSDVLGFMGSGMADAQSEQHEDTDSD